MQHVITFHPNGTFETLYTDKLDLRALGPITVRRASTIEFNWNTQEWEVWFIRGALMPRGEPAFSHPSREACLQWEHDYLNQ